MKKFKFALTLMSFRRKPFEIQANRLRQKRSRLSRDGIFLFFFYISLAPPVDAAFAQAAKNDSLIVGNAAPTFFLRHLNGGEFYLSNYCGKLREPWKNPKPAVVILSFFATWCEPCWKEIVALEEIAAKFAGPELKIFLINVNEKPEIVTWFAGKHQIKLPILLDPYGLVAQKYGADKLPRYVLINKDGKIVLLGKGYSTGFKEKLLKNLSLLLGNIEPSAVRLAQ